MESETLISIVNRLILRGVDINLFIFRDDNNVIVWRPGGRKGDPLACRIPEKRGSTSREGNQW